MFSSSLVMDTKFAGPRLRRESEENLKENGILRTTMTKASRRLVLQDLIQELRIFSVQDCMNRLNHKVHKR